ncbi:MAG: hypothetical protein QNJ30_03875 [Kiloniellales bacterium]|nr:hypothetical protein [Kiloniellales bacterium]
MKSDTRLARAAPSPDDSRLENLEAVWRLATDAFDAAYQCGFQEHVYDPIARRIEDAEKDITKTRASTPGGVAVKLRVVLRHERNETDRRHWFGLLQSALDDLEALKAAEDDLG